MKPISIGYMTSLVQNIITLIGNCENKFVLAGSEGHRLVAYQTVRSTPKMQHQIFKGGRHNEPSQLATMQLQNHIARRRSRLLISDGEIEAGSSQLLEMTLSRIRLPVQVFHISMKEAADLLIACLAYCCEVPILLSGAPTPNGVLLGEIDAGIDKFSACLSAFDAGSAGALEKAIMDESGLAVDFMPHMETFLVSSFILALRDSATQILHMLRHVRSLAERRQRRHDKFRIWIPQYKNLRNWLTSGGEADARVLPKGANKAARQGLSSSSPEEKAEPLSDKFQDPAVAKDEESRPEIISCYKSKETQKLPSKPNSRERKQSPRRLIAQFRGTVADVLEWTQQSDDVEHASNASYSEVKGVWAPMQLILVFKVAIGTSLFVFTVRLFGVIFGCVVGDLSVEIGRGNRVAAVVILLFGVVPSVYVQVATKYVKAGMMSIASLGVVALAAINEPTAASHVFYERLVAFLVGGLVAMVVETLVVPVRARDRLVESLSTSVRQVQKMQAAVAVGIDDPERPNFRSSKLLTRFIHSRDKAQEALAAAEMFLPFCLTEPRLKGSFKPLASIYKEIVYVLHQIIDRMGNVVQLRRACGSSILEDLNSRVYTYRRNVAASSTLILFSVQEALTTWLPLPQLLLSARLAQLRLINRIRELLIGQDPKGPKPNMLKYQRGRPNLDKETASLITQHKFLSWNASTSGQIEIIEYLEELAELVKLLVGVNAF
ncbi:uncharacterized protein MAM_03872 [Metarhizium album ARSEF 1941]|uniref:Integral membrane bound transporter domain-containing protein n=1 Tax=Metarhizium album (strain ARSEF 1941) TaxID=1081103 RepID=A0A0B2WPZ2_METAS|nr:uncharacterized protein MAM_03872 [Metarhizium album ARSEF 1941]KHN98111.1 hypothetical protein MAM_03872 [Metarhizium album ARSEF 1941]